MNDEPSRFINEQKPRRAFVHAAFNKRGPLSSLFIPVVSREKADGISRIADDEIGRAEVCRLNANGDGVLTHRVFLAAYRYLIDEPIHDVRREV